MTPLTNLSRIAHEVREHTENRPSEALSTLLFFHHLAPHLTEEGANTHGALEATASCLRSLESRIDVLEGTAAENQLWRRRNQLLYGEDTLAVDVECAAAFGQTIKNHYPAAEPFDLTGKEAAYYRGLADMWRRHGAFLTAHLFTAAVEHCTIGEECQPTLPVVLGALLDALSHVEAQSQTLQALLDADSEQARAELRSRLAAGLAASAALQPQSTYEGPAPDGVVAQVADGLPITARFLADLGAVPAADSPDIPAFITRLFSALCDALAALQERQDATDMTALRKRAEAGDTAAMLRLKALAREPLPDTVATWMRQTASILENLKQTPQPDDVIFHASQMLPVFEYAQRHLAQRLGVQLPPLPADED